ncbi:putative transposable element encoded protein [Trachipleistophora hominis]|uniref:Putative transposable element encoded protein n=1 Tax=Trachipleistophora hominis TaxID=72359 RepID=L7JYX4_TRAHO|nr:putative transposable element encoded protein [Trachipleistophora hominis]
MLGCRELNMYENLREEKFLGVLLGGRCPASHDLRVKVTAAIAAYLSIVVRVRAKVLHEATH